MVPKIKCKNNAKPAKNGSEKKFNSVPKHCPNPATKLYSAKASESAAFIQSETYLKMPSPQQRILEGQPSKPNMQTKQHNFGAGPCILAPEVLQKAAEAVIDWNSTGLSILEVSHRSSAFEKVMEQTRQLVRETLKVPKDYQILLLQGGASTQFSMLAENLLSASGRRKACYIDTGYFAQKAIAQAKLFGEVEVVASSKKGGYSYIPKLEQHTFSGAYLHLTSNNTIEGTEFFDFPKSDIPLVCDMSSDIFSREINVKDFGLIYAGAQKNLGPAGMTLVIISDELLNGIQYELPAMSDYRVHAQNGSMYNTPPVFAIYVAMLNLQWLKSQGGVKAMERRNRQKSDLLYQALEDSKLFHATAEKKHRSRMNITFKSHDPAHEKGFLEFASQNGVVGLKGYRTVGGFRASLYNALPMESVVHLISVISQYERQQTSNHG